VAGWLSYGIIIRRPSLILWNAVSLALGLAMLSGKLRFRA